jgi:hypothetical protein
MGTNPQEFFGAGAWSYNAARAGHGHAFALEERHADGRRWVELKRFATKGEARAAMDALIAVGAERDRYRVERVEG